MPRIRTIKPDFWDSPDTAAADLRTRLLYIAMWNWADDYGIGDATPVRIIGFAFPNDPIPASDYPRLLADVSGAFGVVFFDHLGRRYYAIPAWDEHQRTEKKAKPKEGLLEAATAAIENASAARQTVAADYPQPASENPPQSDGPSVPGSRKWEVGKGTEEPPYPPGDEPPPSRAPARQTGSDAVRNRIANLPARSVDAYRIAEAFSASLPTPIEDDLLSGIGVQIDKCLKRGIPPPAIAAGLKAWTNSDSWSPTQISNFVHKANNGGHNGKPTEKALGHDAALAELLQEVTTL